MVPAVYPLFHREDRIFICPSNCRWNSFSLQCSAELPNLALKIKATCHRKRDVTFTRLEQQTCAIVSCNNITSNCKLHRPHPSIVSSQSNGNLSIAAVTPTGLVRDRTWLAHEYEAWVAAFDSFNPSVVYSGADDCTLKGWDMRINNSVEAPIFIQKYEVGVTAIQCSPHTANTIAVGSYDETLCLWDTRSMKLPMTKISLGGGIWRVKWHPRETNLLLVACMRAGFKVVNANPTHSPVVVASHRSDECEALAYGIDWCFSNNFPKTAAVCSFYDRHVSLWSFL